jgi:hypothetical protein
MGKGYRSLTAVARRKTDKILIPQGGLKLGMAQAQNS